jgi:sulfopyruvate decarboxylase alpha subunit
MGWAESIVACLKQFRIRYINYVPDAIGEKILQVARQDAAFEILPLTREEEGVGVVCGQSIGGARGVLMMPTSGLGNSINALASLPIPYRIPVPMLIGFRGALGEFNAAQVPMGQATSAILAALNIPHFALEREEEVQKLTEGALKLTYALESPVAILVTTQLAGWKNEQ